MTDPIVPPAPDMASEIERRRRAETSLRRYRVEQQVLLDMIPAMVWLKDPENRIIRANRLAAEASGIRVEDLENKSTYDLFPDEAAKYHKDDLEVIRSGRPKLGIVEQFTTEAGDKRWVQTDKVPYFDDAGQPIGVVVFAHDITNRKREQDWHQTLARGLRGIIEIADELIVCPDMDTFYRRAVELAREKLSVERCAIFHFDRHVARGTFGTDLEGVTTDERKNSFKIVKEWEEHFSTIRPQQSRWVLKEDVDQWNWDGSRSTVAGRGWVSYTAIARARRRAIALFIHDGAISRTPFDPVKQEILAVYCSMLAELIEQKRSEEVLRESEKKFRSLAETIEASIFLFQGPRLTYVNPAAAKMSGYPAKELLRMKFWDLIHPDFRETVRKRGTARQSGRDVPARYEVKILTRQGLVRWVDYSSNVIEFEGKPAVLGVAFDITDRKMAEAELHSRMERQLLTLRIATDLSNASGRAMEARVKKALKEVAQLLDVQVSCLMLFSDDAATITEVHESLARGVPSIRRMLRDVLLNKVRLTSEALLRGDVVQVDSVSRMPAAAKLERSISRRAGIRSFAIVPVVGRGRVSGALGIASTRGERTWIAGDVTFLKLIGDILANAVYRERLEEEHTRLANKVLELQEEERKKLSDILHDDVGQILTLMSIQLGAVKTADRKSTRNVRSASKETRSVLNIVRDLAGSLRPPILDDLGVAAGLRTLCREFKQRSGLKVNCAIERVGVVLGEAQRTCLYRVLQEALTNIARHSHAKKVSVKFAVRDGVAMLEVRDDGCGFNVNSLSRRKGIGLIGMKERLHGCGGTLDIQSSSGTGTRIRATVRRGDRSRFVGANLQR